MINMNEVIAGNICKCLEERKQKQNALAEFLGVSKQTVSKMLCGARSITAPELSAISKFLGVSMENLVAIPTNYGKFGISKIFMGKISSEAGLKGVEIADQLIDLYLFHRKFQSDSFIKAASKEWKNECAH